jgi:serine protease AprX
VEGSLDYATSAAGASFAHDYGWDGKRIGVAVIDSGVYDHPDLKDAECSNNRVVYKQSFIPGDSNLDDKYGHGTHVAGVLAGNGKCSDKAMAKVRLRGVAPQARIVSLRVLDRNG